MFQLFGVTLFLLASKVLGQPYTYIPTAAPVSATPVNPPTIKPSSQPSSQPSTVPSLQPVQNPTSAPSYKAETWGEVFILKKIRFVFREKEIIFLLTSGCVR